jgi:valyl-tRNA synthetase
LSDAEVEYVDKPGHLWHIRYPLTDGNGEVVVATTRPETMLGDTAVAVHPDDERYQALVGKTLKLPLTDREIPVVADAYVDPTFGTGCVKITPAHDPNDFEVGKRHDLPVIRVMNDDGTMNELAGKYQGMDRYVARKQMVADLEAQGNLVKMFEKLQIPLEIRRGLWYTIMEYFYSLIGRPRGGELASLPVVFPFLRGTIPALHRIKNRHRTGG